MVARAAAAAGERMEIRSMAEEEAVAQAHAPPMGQSAAPTAEVAAAAASARVEIRSMVEGEAAALAAPKLRSFEQAGRRR